MRRGGHDLNSLIRNRFWRIVVVTASLWVAGGLSSVAIAAEAEPTAEQIEFFEKQIRPVFVKHCYECHAGDDPKANFRLDVRSGMMQGGDSGPAIVPGKPAESILISAVNYDPDGYQMPPKSKMSDVEVAAITKWVEIGAPWPNEAHDAGVKKAGFDLAARKAKHWSFQPIQTPDLPAVQNADWVKTPIDAFLLSKMEAAGLTPNAPADKRTLIRRATFDLIGLPPTPAEIDAFLADDSPDAFARVVDRLLASPHYGERWTRHWLDLARFAETYGHEFDFEIPNAYHYRDYLIRAFNEDVPFDQLVKEQVAGDLLPAPRRRRDDNANESVIGTGFWLFGEAKHSPVDVRGDEADRIDNQIDVFAKTFLGLTVSCARCHDHKFDAISTKDYYALAGFLQSSRYQQAFIDDRAPVVAKAQECAALMQQARELSAALLSSSPVVSRNSSAAAILAAAEVLRGETFVDSAATLNPGDKLFEDFEGETFTHWKAEGEAFARGPNRQPIPQGNVNELGRGFINTFSVANENGRAVGDHLKGRLTSEPFTVDRRYLHFLIGGGKHPQKACLNVLVDGRVVRTATGRNDDKMRWTRFDLADLHGKTAQVQIVDDDKATWVQVGVDQIILSDAPFGPRQNAVEAAVQKHHADAEAVADWIVALDAAQSTRAPTYLSPIAKLLLSEHESGEAFAQLLQPLRDEHARRVAAGEQTANQWTVVEDFTQPGWNGWLTTGEAFGEGPTQTPTTIFSGDAASPVTTSVPAGVAHSGLVADRLQGALRSPTFELTSNFLQLRVAGRGKVNIVMDGLQLIRYPIYGELTFDVAQPEFAWRQINTGMWIGHKVYIELLDEGDGWLALDEVRQSNVGVPGASGAENAFILACVHDVPQNRADVAARLARSLQVAANENADAAWAKTLGPTLVELRGFLYEQRLFPAAGGDSTNDAESKATSSKLAETLRKHREIAASIPLSRRAPAMCDGTQENECVHIRGSHKNLGPPVERRLLEGLSGVDNAPREAGSGRLSLAMQMLDPQQNPLTPRVFVNRLWHHHFGRGIVASCDDFGNMGQAPTHPELLDWLASDFVAHGWSIKRMHRLMLLSAAYQSSSKASDESLTLDPLNRLWSRMPIRRLDAESIRDAILAVSGRFDPKLFGGSVPPHLTEFMNGRGRPGGSGPLDGNGRRSLYINVRRNFLTPMFLAFDYPQPFTAIGRRSVSNVPAQALALLNNPFVVQQADIWAKKTLGAAPSFDERLRAMYITAFAREPRAEELTAAKAFLDSQREKYQGDEQAAWRDLAHVLFNVKEFIFVN